MSRSHFSTAVFFVFWTGTALIGCGGGNVTLPHRVIPTPTPSPAPTPTPTPSSATATSTLPAAGDPFALPTFGGYTASYVVQSGPAAGTTTTVIVSTVPPAGAPAPQAIDRIATLGARRGTSSSASPTALFYGEESFSSSFVWLFPAWTVTVPSGVSTAGLTLELFDGSSGVLIAAANGSASGQTVTFAFSTPGGQSVVSGHPYLVELVSGSGLNLSFRPNGSGDAFSYTGTLTETFVRAPLTATPTPDPNPSSSQTLTAAASSNVTVSNGATFNNESNLSDFVSSEIDTFASPPQTLTSTTNQYLNFVPNGTSTEVLVVGSTTTDSSGTATSTTYGSGNGLLDVLPEVQGAITPVNTAARTTNETDADAQATTQTFNADGSYSETTNYPGNFTATATENADGSGQYSVPIKEFPNSTFAYAAPSGGNIAIIESYPAGLKAQGPDVVDLTLTDWYPATPPVLYAQSYVNNGAVALPGSCAVPAALMKPANQLVETTTTLDIIFGEIETQVLTSYVSQGLGAVCVQLSDVTTQYYDFTGQLSVFQSDFSSTPIQTTTIAETLGLQSATVTDSTAAARASLSAPLARALTGRFEALVAYERSRRHTGLAKSFHAPHMGSHL